MLKVNMMMHIYQQKIIILQIVYYFYYIVNYSDQAVLDDIYIEEQKVELIEDTDDTNIDNIHTSNIYECSLIKASKNKGLNDETWICSFCSYINSIHNNKCKMCDSVMNKNQLQKLLETKSYSGDSWTCAICSYINSNRYNKCKMCNNANNTQSQLQKTVELKPGMLVTLNHDEGDIKVLYGKTGIYLEQHDDISKVLLLNTDSGCRYIQNCETKYLNVHEKWVGYKIASIKEIYGILSQYLYTSLIHISRILLLILLSVWDESSQKEPLSIRHLSDDGQNVVQYIQLLMSTEKLFFANTKKDSTQGRLFLMVNRVLKNILKLRLLNESNSLILDVYLY